MASDNSMNNGRVDVNALRKEIAQLKKNLSDCYELAEIGHWEFDAVTSEVMCNESLNSIFELSNEIQSPRWAQDFIHYIHPSDMHLFDHYWKPPYGYKEGQTLTIKFRIITGWSKLKYLRASLKPVFNGKDLVKVQGIVQDISSFVAQELNHSMDRLSEDWIKDHDLTWMGGYEIDFVTGKLILSRNLLQIVEFDLGQEPCTIADFIHTCVAPDDKERCILIFESIISQTRHADKCKIATDIYHVEFKLITHRTGLVKNMVSRVVVIRENGNPVKLHGLSVDVTLTKKFEADLIVSQERVKLLFDNMTQGITFHDQTGKVTDMNAAAERILGLTHAEYVGNHVTDFNFKYVNENGTPMTTGLLTSTVLAGKAIDSKVLGLINSETSVIKWIQASFIPMRSSLVMEGFYVLFEDITESRKSLQLIMKTNEQLAQSLYQLTLKNNAIKDANEKLKQTKKELRDALRHLELKTDTLNQQMILLLVSDVNGRIVEVNDRFLEVFGYEHHQVIDTPNFLFPDNIFHSGVQSDEYLMQIREHLAQGHTWNGEICKRSKTGEEIWLLETIVPLKNDFGKIIRFYFYSSVITPLKNRELLITREKRIAEEASRIKEEFVSLMSHEIRTPLNSVIGLTDLLLRRNPRDDQMEIVQALKNSSDNLLYLVNSILDYNKLQAGKMGQEQIHFNLSDYLRNVDRSSKMIAAKHGLNWQFIVDSALPEIVNGDMPRINQILNNLINNAIRFTKQGFIRFEVRLQARVEQIAYVVFEISDSGIGIPNEKLGNIFNPFFQINANGSENSGTGLGLSIVKGLVELLNGHIRVHSELGKGSTFTLEVPLMILPVDEQRNSNQEDDTNVEIKLKGRKVLYVEDVASNRFVVENLLSEIGVDIVTAGSGQEALVFTKQIAFDVILLDIQMPNQDGYATLKAIREQTSGKNEHTTIIAFTAKLLNAKLQQDLEKHRIYDLVVKPFNSQVLLEKIANAIFSGSSKKAKKNNFTFSYYENVLRNNKDKLALVKNEILNDIRELQLQIKMINEGKSLSDLHNIIHRLKPILSNLECQSLKIVLEEYKSHDVSSTGLNELNRRTLPLLKKVTSALKKLPY